MTKLISTMTAEQEAEWVRLMKDRIQEEGALPPTTGLLAHEHGRTTGDMCSDERCLAYMRGYAAGRASVRRG